MIEHSSNGLKYYSFSSLDTLGIKNGIFTRLGGVSPSPWDTLNLGGTVADSRENVVENRLRLFSTFGSPIASLYDVWQAHGNTVKIANSPRNLATPHEKADAIATDKPGITLFMRFADCVPILLFDPKKKAIAIVHAGWIGTVNKILHSAIRTLQYKFGSITADIVAGIGPSIGPDHYEVGSEVSRRVAAEFPENASDLISHSGGKQYFDLWKANEILLRQSGVNSIEQSHICTACNTHEWYSHRAEKGKTGRFAALIKIE